MQKTANYFINAPVHANRLHGHCRVARIAQIGLGAKGRLAQPTLSPLGTLAQHAQSPPRVVAHLRQLPQHDFGGSGHLRKLRRMHKGEGSGDLLLQSDKVDAGASLRNARHPACGYRRISDSFFNHRNSLFFRIVQTHQFRVLKKLRNHPNYLQFHHFYVLI
jgi:hypothetical protein